MTPLSIQQEICRLYSTTRTEVLAKTYGVSDTTIRNIVKRQGGIIKPIHAGNHTTPTWTPEEDAIIREHFATSSNIKAIMPRLPGRTYNAIRTRANAHLGCKMKKFPTHDTHCFDVPNEINCAWAGFIAADGCVSDSGRFYMRLADKDEAHLNQLVVFMGYTGNTYRMANPFDIDLTTNGKITTYQGISKIASIQIKCPYVCAKLKEHWNITPRKTYTLQPPNLTNDRLIMAFISGLVDGDGWIIADHSSKTIQYSLAVMGTTELMQWIKITFDRLVPSANSAMLRPTGSKNICDYKVSGVKAYWLAKMFLSLQIPRLDRKWDKLRRLIDHVETGAASQRFKSTVVACCPSPEILAMFGLESDAERVRTSVRPSVQ